MLHWQHKENVVIKTSFSLFQPRGRNAIAFFSSLEHIQ